MSSLDLQTGHSKIQYISQQTNKRRLSGRTFAPSAGGRGFDPGPRHSKDVIKWYM